MIQVIKVKCRAKIKIQGEAIQALRFANDTVLKADKKKELKEVHYIDDILQRNYNVKD